MGPFALMQSLTLLGTVVGKADGRVLGPGVGQEVGSAVGSFDKRERVGPGIGRMPRCLLLLMYL